MQKTRLFTVLFLGIASLLFTCRSASAQAKTTVQVSFGAFHGVNGGPSQYDDVIWGQLEPTPPPGEYSASSGNCINTSIGYLCAPQSILNTTGHETYELQFSLSPNGQKGSIKGNFNVNYSSEDGGESLVMTVDYSATSD